MCVAASVYIYSSGLVVAEIAIADQQRADTFALQSVAASACSAAHVEFGERIGTVCPVGNPESFSLAIIKHSVAIVEVDCHQFVGLAVREIPVADADTACEANVVNAAVDKFHSGKVDANLFGRAFLSVPGAVEFHVAVGHAFAGVTDAEGIEARIDFEGDGVYLCSEGEHCAKVGSGRLFGHAVACA